MTSLTVFLCLAAGPDPGLPAELQAQEQESTRPEGGMGIVEYVYRYSEFEVGTVYTLFDRSLDIENDWGFYVRGGVRVVEYASLNLTYRLYDFRSSELPGGAEEGLRIHALLGGVGFQLPLTSEFTFKLNGALGLIRWDSDLAHDETGPALAGEAAVCVQVHEALRLKAGVAADLASTDFHDDSHETHLSLSGLFSLEIGF